MPLNDTSYLLRLSDNSDWQFTSTTDTAEWEWLNFFASTLGLPVLENDGSAVENGILICSEKRKSECLLEMGASHWGVNARVNEFQLGPLAVYSTPGSNHLMHVVPNDESHKDWLMSMWYGLYPLYPQLLRMGHLPLHAGLATWRGQGILFAAPGGTGKSTTMRRLPMDWDVHCDDESWLVNADAGLFSHPLPTWSDLVLRGERKSWNSPHASPAKAIVFLRQAESVKINRLSPAECATLLKQATEQILRRAWAVLPPPDLNKVRARVFELADERSRSLHGYLLDLNLTDPFWTTLEVALMKDIAIT